jgi:uncharacterized protein (DUF1697 family)
VTWVVLLRAVNVGRANRIAMADFRAMLETLGYADIRTYAQSGNAVFSAAETSAEAVERAIHDLLLAEAGIDVGVVAVAADELAAIVADNPLLGADGIDEGALHVIVLERVPDASQVSVMQPTARGSERVEVRGRAVYLGLPDGMGNTKLSGGWFERALKLTGTARNWRTTTALLAMALGDDAPKGAGSS